MRDDVFEAMIAKSPHSLWLISSPDFFSLCSPRRPDGTGHAYEPTTSHLLSRCPAMAVNG